MIGFSEIALILVVVLIIFGAGKLPNVMGDLGKGLRSFKEGMKDEAGIKKDDTIANDILPPPTPPIA